MGSAAGVLILVGAGFLGVRMLNRIRVEGDGFKVNVARRVSELAGRKVSFGRFQLASSTTFGTPVVSVTPGMTDLVGSMEMNDLMAELTAGSWMSDNWVLNDLHIRGINVSLQPEKTLSPGNMFPVPVERAQSADGGFRLSITSDPSSIALQTGSFEQLDVSWPGPTGKPESLTKVEGSFRAGEGTLSLETRGGLLETSIMHPLEVQKMNVSLKGSTLDIVSARLVLSRTCTALLSGKAEMVPDGKIELKAEIPPVLLRDILPAVWGEHLAGQFTSSGAKWVSHFKSGPPAEFSGPFTGHGMVIQGFDFIDKIAHLLQDPRLSLLEFQDFKGNFSWTPQGVALKDLSAQSQDGRMRLSGFVEVSAEGSLKGKLHIEASDIYFVARLKTPVPIFTPSGEGWYATDFTISGRNGEINDSIPIVTPVIIQGDRHAFPEIGEPRMTAPPGVTPPEIRRSPEPVPAAPPAESVPVTPALRIPQVAPAPPAARQKSPKEIENEFNELIGK